jgi:DNA-binding NtrC family response regulator
MARILIADDEADVRSFICRAIKQMEHTPVEAADGAEALDKYKTGKIDLSFIDVNMPNMNGLKFLREVKQIDEQAVVIIMTGYPSADTILETIEDDGYTYIAKPLQLAQLEDLVSRGLKSRKIRIEQSNKDGK